MQAALFHTLCPPFSRTRPAPGLQYSRIPPRWHHHYYYPTAHGCGHYRVGSSWKWKRKACESLWLCGASPPSAISSRVTILCWRFIECARCSFGPFFFPFPEPTPPPPPPAYHSPTTPPWCLCLKVGYVCSLALVLSVYLFSSIIKNTQNQTETRQRAHQCLKCSHFPFHW